ncbi:MAG: DUF1854 domain-containing protein [Limnochordales bacterium]|nr:DUF1854 domain-containing protein [Limnochordales bacterium]
MDRLEPAPLQLDAWLRRRGLTSAAVVLIAGADLDENGSFSPSWVVCTRDMLWVIPELHAPPAAKATGGRPAVVGSGVHRPAPSPAPLGEPLRSVALADLEGIRVESLTGNGLLVATVRKEANTEDIILCRFSNSQARKFGLFCRLVDKVRRGEEIQESDIREDQMPQYCPRCGLMYPEPNRPVCPRCLDRGRLFLRVLSFVPRYKRQIALILLCMLASSALRVVSPVLSGRILYDEVLTPGGRYFGQLGPVVLLIFLTQLLALVISIAYGRLNSVMTAQVIYDLKTEVFAAMQRLSMRFFSSRQTGSLMTRVNHDAMHLQYFFHDGVPYFIVNVLMLVGVLIIMFSMDWRLTLLVLLPAPVIVWIARVVMPRLWRLFSRNYHKHSALNALMNDALTGVRVVKAFGREESEICRFGVRNNELFQVALETGNLGATLWPALSFVMSLGGLAVWGLGGAEVIQGRLTFGTMMTFVGYLGMLYGPLDFLAHIVDWWSSCMNSAQRIFEVLDAVPDITDHPQAVRLPRIQGRIELRGVRFGYEPHKPVLHDINLKIEPGEMLGLVGHSGAGKSTITNVITRLYDVDEGEVLIDGVNVKQIALKDLREQIGMVLQDPFLFTGSVAENIAYARPGATPREILRAAKAASAHDFIVQLPDAYDTVIGHRGRDLSGGEKQRIEIARAILRDPRILILDEATSSVDTETEQRIQAALRWLVQDRTTIAIAHRLSTLRDADRLFVLEQGRNVETGTHEELVAKEGTYFKLLKLQREALKIRGVDDEMLAQVERDGEKQDQDRLKEYVEVRYLDPERVRFYRTAGGFLGLVVQAPARSQETCTVVAVGAHGGAAAAGAVGMAEGIDGGSGGAGSTCADGAGTSDSFAGDRTEEYSRVTVYRSFPLSRPDEFISVRDAQGKEIGIIEDLRALPPEMQKLLREELDRRYFTPTIQRVLSVKEEFGYSYWEVETDRGWRRFTMRNSHENVLTVGERGLILIDVDGNRFAIPDYQSLTPAAFRQIESML